MSDFSRIRPKSDIQLALFVVLPDMTTEATYRRYLELTNEPAAAAVLVLAEARQKPAPALLSVNDVASILQVSPSHIYRLADGGKMPPQIKVGGSVRWVRSEIDNWIQGGCKAVRKRVVG